MYKRYLQLISFLVGVAIAVALNADTIHVGKVLWQDHGLAAAIAADSSAVLKAQVGADLGQPGDAQKTQEALGRIKGNIAAYKDTLAPLPIGWSHEVRARWTAFDWSPMILQLFGWFFTALALTLGAPFWFDTLGKVVNLRSAGSKPATTVQLQQAEQGR